MKYSIVTFGCRVNQADSLRLDEDLQGLGWVERPMTDADVVVVNTCSVTATADQGARQTIRRIARENPTARIVATGCYATRCSDDLLALPGVVRVVRNDDKLDLVRILDLAAVAPEATLTSERDGDGPCGARLEPGTGGRTAFTLRVQTGCEEACTYCIIPMTRGASRSMPPESVVREVERIAAAGYREIVLTGVHLGSYGRDLSPAFSLAALLRALDRLPADVRYRISSLEPMDCSPDVVDLVASNGRFQPHFHLPLQHASDRMLTAMGRPYGLAEYRRLLDSIHARLPHASIGSDMIVGFPGETERDFARNVDYLPSSPLTHLHVFPYSDRPATRACAMDGKVHGTVVRERATVLRGIGAALSRRFHDAQLGTVRPGLTLENGTLVVTDNYMKVGIASGLKRNTRVRVRLTGPATGEVVSVESEPAVRPTSAGRGAVPEMAGSTIR